MKTIYCLHPEFKELLRGHIFIPTSKITIHFLSPHWITSRVESNYHTQLRLGDQLANLGKKIDGFESIYEYELCIKINQMDL